MNPKERKPQNQSSRMYLRRRDHRECIMNEKYHNAIWVKKEQGEKEVDELAWVKYPSSSFLYRSRFYTSSLLCSMSYFDIDRQFSFSSALNQSYTSGCIMLEKYVVIPYAYNSGVLRISKDGSVFKEKDFTTDKNVNNAYRFGNNSVIMFTHNGTTFSFDVFHIADDEEKQFDYVIEKTSHSFTTVQATPHYICHTEEGCIIAYISGDFCTTYEMTRLGARRLNAVAFDIKTHTQPTVLKGYCNGDYIAFAIYGRYLDSSNYIMFEHNIFYSTDGGASWNKQLVLTKRYWNMPQYHEEMYCFARNGICYVYSIWNDDLFVWSSSGGGFSEVTVPKAMIVGVVSNCGSDIGNLNAKTCQIKLREDAQTSADIQYSIRDVRFLGWNDAFFKDGEVDKESNALAFNIVIRDSYGYNIYYQVYMDNPLFESSADNVFFGYKTFNSSNTMADSVIEGDYVLRNKNEESEV